MVESIFMPECRNLVSFREARLGYGDIQAVKKWIYTYIYIYISSPTPQNWPLLLYFLVFFYGRHHTSYPLEWQVAGNGWRLIPLQFHSVQIKAQILHPSSDEEKFTEPFGKLINHHESFYIPTVLTVNIMRKASSGKLQIHNFIVLRPRRKKGRANSFELTPYANGKLPNSINERLIIPFWTSLSWGWRGEMKTLATCAIFQDVPYPSTPTAKVFKPKQKI